MDYFAKYQSFVEGNNCLVATGVVTDRAKAKRVKDVRKRLESGQRVFLT